MAALIRLVVLSCAVARSAAGLFEEDIEAEWGLVAGDYGVQVADDLVAAGVVTPPPPGARRELGLTTSDSLLWNDVRSDRKIYIPLAYDSIYSVSQVNFMRDAANALGDLIGIVQFVDRTTETAYIEFVEGSGCSSRIGRGGGRQTISILRSGCMNTGIIQHEIMHAMGVWHEQSREDRDAFVTINLQNVESGKEHNFNKRATRSLGSSYDYRSVMHYGQRAFSSNGQNTIDVPSAAPTPIGQRTGASPADVAQLILLYERVRATDAPTASPSVSPTPQPSGSPTPPTIPAQGADAVVMVGIGGGAVLAVLGLSAAVVALRRRRARLHVTARGKMFGGTEGKTVANPVFVNANDARFFGAAI